MDSPLAVNIPKVRAEAVQRAKKELTRAKTTQEKHAARRALQKARRAAGGQDG